MKSVIFLLFCVWNCKLKSENLLKNALSFFCKKIVFAWIFPLIFEAIRLFCRIFCLFTYFGQFFECEFANGFDISSYFTYGLHKKHSVFSSCSIVLYRLGWQYENCIQCSVTWMFRWKNEYRKNQHVAKMKKDEKTP